jgi:transposase-like protein
MDKDKKPDIPEEVNKGGRPTKYDPEITPLLVWSYLQGGDTIKQIAEKLEVNPDTIYEWASKYPAFSDTIKNGREKTNAEVEQTLLKRAMGYTYNRVKIETDKEGKVIKKTAETMHVIPDALSIKLWLNNRKPEKWKDKQEISHSGDVAVNIIDDIGKK